DWYVSLVRSQCYSHSDSALLEGAELVNRIPSAERLPFMVSKEFNLSLLAPCLSLGVNLMLADQDSSFFETVRSVILDLISQSVQQLPNGHQLFQPLQPIDGSSYWEKLSLVLGNEHITRSHIHPQ
ncbi:hypothetical protein GDO81_028134, partial [Engystomops pustulosus]